MILRLKRRCVRQVASAANRLKRPHKTGVTAGMASAPERWPAGAPDVGGLIGDAGVIGAIRQARHRLSAAEEEVLAARIADRPAARLLRKLEQRAPLPDRDDVVDQFGFDLDLVIVGMR